MKSFLDVIYYRGDAPGAQKASFTYTFQPAFPFITKKNKGNLIFRPLIAVEFGQPYINATGTVDDKGWQVGAGPTFSYSRETKITTFPIGLGVRKVAILGKKKQPVQVGAEAWLYAAQADALGPQWTLRLTIAPGYVRSCIGHTGLSPSVAYLGVDLDPADVLAEELTPRVCATDIFARLVID